MKLVISISILLFTNFFAPAQINYKRLKNQWCKEYSFDNGINSDTLVFTKIRPNDRCNSTWYSKDSIHTVSLKYIFSNKNCMYIETYSQESSVLNSDSTDYSKNTTIFSDTTRNASGEMIINDTMWISIRNYLPPPAFSSYTKTEYRLDENKNLVTVYWGGAIIYKIISLTAEKMILVLLK